jgi:squalene synthase HpnC
MRHGIAVKMETNLELLAAKHYENFPVASVFVPKRQRKALRLIYAFARAADDFADEGDASVEERLECIDRWESALHDALGGKKASNFFQSLARVIRDSEIPVKLFEDLLAAFRIDARGPHFVSIDDLVFYCRHSANPVGRIVLHLFGSATEQHCIWSDDICTALQLANFWQDISVDIQKKRVYIPDEDFERFGSSRERMLSGIADEQFRTIVKFEVERTKQLFVKGVPLLQSVDTKLRFQLKLTWHGGMRVLEKIEQHDYETFHRRLTLNLFDSALIFMRSLRPRMNYGGFSIVRH